jgi:alpha-tubulin suppressor-like RCC1 family protein
VRKTPLNASDTRSVATKTASGLSVLYCWGYNLYGQLGNGTSGDNEDAKVPTRVTGGDRLLGLDGRVVEHDR